MCLKSDAEADKHEIVAIRLVLPADQAATLVRDFHDKKLSGEPATVAVNVMHVQMIGTSGDLDDGTVELHGKRPSRRLLDLTVVAIVYALIIFGVFALSAFALRMTVVGGFGYLAYRFAMVIVSARVKRPLT